MLHSDDYTRAELEAVGGSYWVHGDRRRVYFNNLAELVGLVVERHRFARTKAPAIVSARYRGVPVSPVEARAFESQFAGAKLWYDVDRRVWRRRNLAREHFDDCVAALRSRLTPPSSSTAANDDAVPATRRGPRAA